MADMEFYSEPAGYGGSQVTITEAESATEPTKADPYPSPMIDVGKDRLEQFMIWLDAWLLSLESSHSAKLTEWSEQETDYRARSLGPQSIPFKGASGDVVPAIAMAVDPIHARLDTGIFKADPVIRLKGLRKSFLDYIPALETWIEFYQKYRLQLRRVSSPRLLELTKHGTAVFKVIYDRETYPVKTYDDNWNVIKRQVTRFSGPRVFGVSLNDFMFPPHYQDIQLCPIVAERQRVSYEQLKIAEASKKLVNCSQVRNQEKFELTELERERALSANHQDSTRQEAMLIEIFEIWCEYDIDGDGIPERLICTYHRDTRTILQLRYNFYFHQRKPYVVIPYTITNDSIYGIGIAEMVKPFQDMLTKFQRMASDNAYIANTRMFIAKKESGVEKVPTIYAGKVFFVDDPSKDFKEFQMGEVYPSSLSERQNLFGLSEKRTGVSDYLTGRESPVVGSRATATSTLALIQEGTKRVEQVLENIRNGFAEIVMMCMYIWIQYGFDDLDAVVFGDDDVQVKLRDFFDNIGKENIDGALAIDLAATDAANNRSVQQQTALALIQVVMQYLTQVLQAGQQAIQMAGQVPEMAQWITEVSKAARTMFRDLLNKYEIRNPDDYLPDLERFLDEITGGSFSQSGAAGGANPPTNGAVGPAPVGPLEQFTAPNQPAAIGGNGVVGSIPFAGAGQGLPPGITGY